MTDDNGACRGSHTPKFTITSLLVIKPGTPVQPRSGSSAHLKGRTAFFLESKVTLVCALAAPATNPGLYWKEGTSDTRLSRCLHGHGRGRLYYWTGTVWGLSQEKTFVSKLEWFGEKAMPTTSCNLKPSTQGPWVGHTISTYPHSLRKVPSS